MKKIIRFFKRIFGKYKTGYEYWVDLNDIKIPRYLKNKKIGMIDWNRKIKYWLETGEFESYILLSKDFTLVDGYSSYKIAKQNGLDIVPVYFVD